MERNAIPVDINTIKDWSKLTFIIEKEFYYLLIDCII